MVTRSTLGEIDDLRNALDRALRGAGAPVWLSPDTPSSAVPHDICLALRTSGSTAEPKTVLFDPAPLQALTSWVHGAHDPVWIAALPFTGMGGLNVLIRSVATTHEPIIARSLIDDVPFTDHVFADAVEQAGSRPIFTSLVPTQFHRLMQTTRGREALEACTRVLVGGAALDISLTNERVISTYGMTETSGGCVFNGTPAPGVAIDILQPDPHGVGRIAISGSTVAWGYLDGPSFGTSEGVRTLVSNDLGRMTQELEVLGRVDDIIQVKGVNVSVNAVQADAGELTIVPIPHPIDGMRIVAVTETPLRDEEWESLCTAIRVKLGDAAVPRRLVVMNPLPTTHSGKVDVRTIQRELREDT